MEKMAIPQFRGLGALKSLATLVIIFFLVVQILEIFFEVNYHAVPTFFLNQLNPGVSIPIRDLMTEDRRRFYASRRSIHEPFVPGLHRRNCGCDNYDKLKLLDLSNSSTCSLEASLFSQQKVISYSLYLESTDGKTFFLDGVGPNLEKIKQIYPGWVVRIYTNIPINNHSCKFICKHTFLFWCDVTNLPKLGDLSEMNGRVWRYLVLGDPTVDLFVSRDLDSTPSLRERQVVAEWENSNKSIHVIRDSHWHDTEVLAGLWGLKNSEFARTELDDLQAAIIRVGDRSKNKFWDQEIVERYIYSPFRERVMAHDSYFCRKYPDGLTRPFPVQRVGQEFVGHDDRKEMNRLMVGRLKSCPLECRPENGKDWTYC